MVGCWEKIWLLTCGPEIWLKANKMKNGERGENWRLSRGASPIEVFFPSRMSSRIFSASQAFLGLLQMRSNPFISPSIPTQYICMALGRNFRSGLWLMMARWDSTVWLLTSMKFTITHAQRPLHKSKRFSEPKSLHRLLTVISFTQYIQTPLLPSLTDTLKGWVLVAKIPCSQIKHVIKCQCSKAVYITL